MKWIASIAGMGLVLFVAAMVLVLCFGVRDPFHGSIPVTIFMYGIGFGTFSFIFRAMSRRDVTLRGTQVKQEHVRSIKPQSVSLSNNTSLAERKYYAQAYEECEHPNRRDQGLWAKAISLMQGDEKATVAAYIQLRVAQLTASHNAESHHSMLLAIRFWFIFFTFRILCCILLLLVLGIISAICEWLIPRPEGFFNSVVEYTSITCALVLILGFGIYLFLAIKKAKKERSRN